MTITHLGVVTLGVLLASPSWAETASPPRPLAVHLGGGFALPAADQGANGNPGWAELGVGAGYQLSRRLEIELGLGSALQGSRLVRAADGPAEEDFRTGVGVITRALLRVCLLDGSWRPVLGVGPALAFGGRFGLVPLGQAEAGLELRRPGGFYLLAALRAYVPLARSRAEIDPGRCLTGDCPSRFQPGRPILGSRVAAGFTF
jgi:hypothetical protein